MASLDCQACSPSAGIARKAVRRASRSDFFCGQSVSARVTSAATGAKSQCSSVWWSAAICCSSVGRLRFISTQCWASVWTAVASLSAAARSARSSFSSFSACALILAAIGFQQLVERGGVALRALPVRRPRCGSVPGRPWPCRARGTDRGRRKDRAVTSSCASLELFLGLRKLLRFRGDVRAHFARQIVESREQDDDNQES